MARHLFGAEQRRQRQLNGDMSLDALADVVNYSKTQLHGVETAERIPFPPLPGKLDAAFGTDGLFDGLWRVIEREQYPDRYRRFMELAAQATDICEYAGHMVPGLLQTEAYARALLRIGAPEASADDVDEWVATRMSRQDRLSSDVAPYLWTILDEAVLRRPVGGRAVMYEQFAKLQPLVDTARSKIQVLPFTHGEHALLGGSLTLLTLPNRSSVAYLEGIGEGQLIETPAAVRRRHRSYDLLRAYALSPRESAALIERAMEDFNPCEALPT
ncbi:DUF5753 domain-containing protein [Streptomyces hainanensis]|uniref:XRE family transcriptional regulator n=1 Tax=Streptomyces hainanensis TaxID=402648 RepID=A0A4V2Y2W5_9ACTN|nr:DUF5753 domain-containing protein [Streptomyces hainanensis]TDC74235.1 XRE family transcriptional regulator [Streptomyces hainanensis]